ncbi:MAG: RHS repeat-associated core domain-containing protein [Candidatus Omnitrophica bacterium]|nr:RHS repeat-associated core domain-containing protein [Candidatus Omnitrophota bacterium]
MDTSDDVILPASSLGNLYFFTGREYDPESGLYHYRARTYDPGTGTFHQEDPLWGISTNPSTLNRYAYVANNPTNFVDPQGTSLLAVTAAILASVMIFQQVVLPLATITKLNSQEYVQAELEQRIEREKRAREVWGQEQCPLTTDQNDAKLIRDDKTSTGNRLEELTEEALGYVENRREEPHEPEGYSDRSILPEPSSTRLRSRPQQPVIPRMPRGR